MLLIVKLDPDALVVDSRVKPPPAAGALQANPVAVELSATKPRTISEDCAS